APSGGLGIRISVITSSGSRTVDAHASAAKKALASMLLFVVTTRASRATNAVPTSVGLTATHPQLKHRPASFPISAHADVGVSSVSMLLTRSEGVASIVRMRPVLSKKGWVDGVVNPLGPAVSWPGRNDSSIR